MLAGSARGHLLALATVLLWGITFVSTKILLGGLTPAEVLVLRFVIGYAALWAIRPRRLRVAGWRDELLFVAAGICGVTLSFMIENTALTLTSASNVGVINAASPLFTGIITAYILKGGKLAPRFFVGFALAITGIALISLTGGSSSEESQLTVLFGDPGLTSTIGCVMAVGIAIMSAVYSNILQRISAKGYDSIMVTRRVFFWGLVGMIPFVAVLGFSPDWGFLMQPIPLANLLFLGLGASAACYAMWTAANKALGPVTTMTYQYLVPVITIAVSVAVLGEPLTPAIVAGAVLTICGLVLSQTGSRLRGK